MWLPIFLILPILSLLGAVAALAFFVLTFLLFGRLRRDLRRLEHRVATIRAQQNEHAERLGQQTLYEAMWGGAGA